MKKENSNFEMEDFRDIIAGRFKDQYIAYGRKSTDDLDNQKNSLSYQREQILRYAAQQRLLISPITILGFARDGVVSEKHSAFSEEASLVFTSSGGIHFGIQRPKFRVLVKHLSQKHFKGVIFLCWDRASRNDGDANIVKKLIRQGVDVRFVLATYDDTSSGALHMDIDSMFSIHYSRVTGEKVRLATEKNRRQGLCTYRAPLGYLNLGSMNSKPLDPMRAPIVIRMFELAREGWSCLDLARWAGEQGLAAAPMRPRRTRAERLRDEELDNPVPRDTVCRPLTAASIHRILRNPFYAGMVMDEFGGWIKSASHKPLVSAKLFQEVQRQLTNKYRGQRYRITQNHPFRRMVTCFDCGRVYSPYIQKDILYFSSRCKDSCTNTNRNINFDFLKLHISKSLGKFQINFVSAIDELLAIQPGDRIEEAHQKEADEIDRKLKKLTAELKYIQDNKLTLLKSGAYSPDELSMEAQQLANEVKAISENRVTELPSSQVLANEIGKLSEQLKTLVDYWEKAIPEENDAFARGIYSELLVSPSGLKTKAIPGLRLFESPFAILGGPKVEISELATHFDEIRAAAEVLTKILAEAPHRLNNQTEQSSS